MPRNYTASEVASLVPRDAYKIAKCHHPNRLPPFNQAVLDSFRRGVFVLIAAAPQYIADWIDEEGAV